MANRRRARTLVVHSFLIAALAVSLFPLLQADNARAASRVTTFGTFDTELPFIALTFDVTFDRGDGPMILDILADRGVRATFALTGRWAQDNPDLVRQMVNGGHFLMNHTWDHPSFTGEYTGSINFPQQDPIPSQEIIRQLQTTENLIRQQVGVDLRPYVRPPYGDYDNRVLTAMADAGYTYNIMWTVDTLGWHGIPVSQVQQRVINAAQPGANILMHVGHGATDGAALPGMIDTLRDMGYEFATVEEFVEGDFSGPATRYFPQTDQEISGNFLLYWLRFGGLPIFGYPVSPEIELDGMTVQYFERARFELQPGTWPERHDIHLSRIGSEMTRDRTSEVPFQPVDAESDDHCTYFPQSQHTLCGGFRDYWEQFGGLGIYGYPISQEFREANPDTDETYVVQYFERQRFEWHPGEWPERHDVLLGRVGAQAFQEDLLE